MDDDGGLDPSIVVDSPVTSSRVKLSLGSRSVRRLSLFACGSSKQEVTTAARASIKSRKLGEKSRRRVHLEAQDSEDEAAARRSDEIKQAAEHVVRRMSSVQRRAEEEHRQLVLRYTLKCQRLWRGRRERRRGLNLSLKLHLGYELRVLQARCRRRDTFKSMLRMLLFLGVGLGIFYSQMGSTVVARYGIASTIREEIVQLRSSTGRSLDTIVDTDHLWDWFDTALLERAQTSTRTWPAAQLGRNSVNMRSYNRPPPTLPPYRPC